MQIKLNTEAGKSYWDKTGAYQEQYQSLYEKLVPTKGNAKSLHGELIRIGSNLIYEFCNNGNCNLLDVEEIYETYTTTEDCETCGGSGEDESGGQCEDCINGSVIEEHDEVVGVEVSISSRWQIDIDFLKENLTDKEAVKNLDEFLLDKEKANEPYKYDDSEMSIYNKLMDSIMYQVLTIPHM